LKPIGDYDIIWGGVGAHVAEPCAQLQSLPLDVFPGPGTEWRANFIRYYDMVGKNATGSNTYGNRFHAWRFFGQRRFR